MRIDTHDGQRPVEQIEAEIDRTRDELDRTLHAIEQRLSPGQMLDQGWRYLRRSGAREYFERLGDSMKRDPLPITLVGIGLAWLMVSDRRHAAGDGADSNVESIAERASRARHRMGESAHAARERAGELAHAARARADRVRGGFEHLLDEQPLALGAIGLAAGAILAGMAPTTEREEALARESRIDTTTESEAAVPADMPVAAAPTDTTMPVRGDGGVPPLTSP